MAGRLSQTGLAGMPTVAERLPAGPRGRVAAGMTVATPGPLAAYVTQAAGSVLRPPADHWTPNSTIEGHLLHLAGDDDTVAVEDLLRGLPTTTVEELAAAAQRLANTCLDVLSDRGIR